LRLLIIDVTLHPEAVRELRAAFLWYFDRNPLVAHSFRIEAESALETISQDPNRWAIFQGANRKYVFPRFPFNLVYRVHPETVEVIAFSHQKRKPGYWKGR
jgi:plasmid stabilization system protein ParE